MKRAVKTFLFGLAVLIGVLLLGTFTGHDPRRSARQASSSSGFWG